VDDVTTKILWRLRDTTFLETSCIKTTKVLFYWSDMGSDLQVNAPEQSTYVISSLPTKLKSTIRKSKICQQNLRLDFFTKPLQGKQFTYFHNLIPGKESVSSTDIDDRSVLEGVPDGSTSSIKIRIKKSTALATRTGSDSLTDEEGALSSLRDSRGAKRQKTTILLCETRELLPKVLLPMELA
jgi:hypothetical protein